MAPMKTSFLLLVFCIVTIDAFPIAKSENKVCLVRWTMYIIDGIGAPIDVHIQSSDDDLGVRTLAPGSNFNWTFCVNWNSSTLFYAHFYWNSKEMFFNVFSMSISKSYCRNGKFFKPQQCFWLVREDGFYLSQLNNPFPQGWIKVHDWSS